MPKTVKKELLKINKVIHPNSRKMSKLSKQSKRISAREKSKLVNNMKKNLIGEKLLWFKEHLEPGVTCYTPALSKQLIERYLKRFEPELQQIALKHNIGQRKNRQHANREDIIKLTILQEENEFATCGIEVPDLMNPKQLEMLQTWNGELRYLQNFKLQHYSSKSLGSVASTSVDVSMETQKTVAESTTCDEEVNKNEVLGGITGETTTTEEKDVTENNENIDEGDPVDVNEDC